MSLSDFRDSDDFRSLDQYNASNVKPVAKSNGYYDFPCEAGTRGLHYHTTDESRQECAPREAKLAADRAYRYTDAWLDEVAVSGMPGERHSAPYLRKLDTKEQRERAVAEAHTLSNIRGGIHSSNVYSAVSEMLRNIAAGNESKELYGERFAREAREAEKALRERTGNPNAIYYPAFPGRG